MTVAFKTPPLITEAAIEAGEAKASTPVDRVLVAGILAGAFIAFGGLLGIVVTAGLAPTTGMPALVMGAAFSVGLVLVVIAGAELVTGGAPLTFMAAFHGRVGWMKVGRYTLWATVGNLIGALLVAYFLAVKSGVVVTPIGVKRLTAIATLKGATETDWQIFLRAVGCNWLVCLAVWMAMGAEDVGSKILAIFFPITAFVAMGFDHVVANMFFLPAAIFAHVPGIDWLDAVRNWGFAALGNLVGAGVFVSGAYWYLYGRLASPSTAPALEHASPAEAALAASA